ncbi:MAG: FAD-dependent oxidoreductase [Planctomycetes bacterium]|nr:FAD-dependent oxidoreductase [Planctomycetota bacterium]
MSEKVRLVIVGGVAGGASAAARARRISEEASIVMFERGAHISFANCGLPYHIGGVIEDRKRLLVQTPEAMKKRFNIDVRVLSEVVRIDRAARQVIVRQVETGKEYAEPYDKLILSPGAEPIRPPIAGLDSPGVFTLRNIADMDAIKKAVAAQPADKAGRALIIGGGYIGLEMAEAMRNRGLDVALAELADQVFGPFDREMASPIHAELKRNGVDLRLKTSVEKISAGPAGLVANLSDGARVDCSLAILAIGVRPDVALARQAGLTIGPTGGIAVDDHLRTSDPDIFAVGDAVEVIDLVGERPALIPLAGPANRQGRIAADNALGRDAVYRRTLGTAICKVFHLAAAMTGLSEKACKKLGRACEKIYIHPASHAGYYPGAAQMTIKLLFDPAGGKLLGAQAVGTDGVDKRIDVLATAIRAGMTAYDLENLELSYAPPYGSAKDPVNYAGFVAANALRGDVRLCHAADAISPRDDQMLLDVRTPGEVQAGTIPGAAAIPIDELRSRLGELPKDKEILAFCQVGLRGYLACRILGQAGFACRNLSGGYRTYQMFTDSLPAGAAPAAAKKEMKEDTGMMGPTVSACGAAGGLAADAVKIDACGLQCPGPIMRIKEQIDQMSDGQRLEVIAGDPGFAADVAGWCSGTGNELVDLQRDGGILKAVIIKRTRPVQAGDPLPADSAKNKTIVVFSGDFDRAMAAFVIANGAAAMGGNVTMFFTFWGLNVLRRSDPPSVSKTLVERMFGWMMPRGAGKLKLSKMNMAGCGLAMIKGIMKKKNVASLTDLIESAKRAGVKLVACSMSMDLMGIKMKELIDGVEAGGVAMYLAAAQNGNVNLFI